MPCTGEVGPGPSYIAVLGRGRWSPVQGSRVSNPSGRILNLGVSVVLDRPPVRVRSFTKFSVSEPREVEGLGVPFGVSRGFTPQTGGLSRRSGVPEPLPSLKRVGPEIPTLLPRPTRGPSGRGRETSIKGTPTVSGVSVPLLLGSPVPLWEGPWGSDAPTFRLNPTRAHLTREGGLLTT